VLAVGATLRDAAGNETAVLVIPAGHSLADQKDLVIDTVAPTATINQAAGQADPASTTPLRFTVAFSEPVTGFASSDLILGGTAGATTATVTGSGTTYTAAVSGMRRVGTVTASFAAGAAADLAGNPSAAPTSTDNTVTFTAIHQDTIGVFDLLSAKWYLRTSNSAGGPSLTPFAFGAPGFIPVVGDWDGDGRTTLGAYDPATGKWYLKNTNAPGGPDVPVFAFGGPGLLPLVGDWDGNGTTTVGVFSPATATFYLRNSNSAGGVSIVPFAFGGANWKPLAGDWDGNGTTTIGVFSPAGVWYLRNSNATGGPDMPVFAYGAGSWQPVTGDWDGNGTTTVGVFDAAGNWYLRNSNSGGVPSISPFAYGAGTWKPEAGDWDFPNTSIPAPVAFLPSKLSTAIPSTAVAASTAVPTGHDTDRLDAELLALLITPTSGHPRAGEVDRGLGGDTRLAVGFAPEPAGVVVRAWAQNAELRAVGSARSSDTAAEAVAWLADVEGARARHQRDLDDLFATGW
jgi:hypothetical protein